MLRGTSSDLFLQVINLYGEGLLKGLFPNVEVLYCMAERNWSILCFGLLLSRSLLSRLLCFEHRDSMYCPCDGLSFLSIF